MGLQPVERGWQRGLLRPHHQPAGHAVVVPAGAGRVFFRPAGRPGPGRAGCGAPAGQAVCGRMCRKSRRTRAGVSLSGELDCSHGRRRSAASGRARRSWVWATRMSQVQRSAASNVRIFGGSAEVCLNRRKVCSMSKRRRYACRRRSASAAVASVVDKEVPGGCFEGGEFRRRRDKGLVAGLHDRSRIVAWPWGTGVSRGAGRPGRLSVGVDTMRAWQVMCSAFMSLGCAGYGVSVSPLKI